MTYKMLGLDIGDSRIGVAVCESGVLGARPLKTIPRAQGRAEREILQLIDQLGIQTVVAGLPLDESGALTKQCQSVQQFCRRLERRSSAKIVFHDEYASSCEALERLKQNGTSKAWRNGDRGLLDAVSAAIILESFLRTHSTNSNL